MKAIKLSINTVSSPITRGERIRLARGESPGPFYFPKNMKSMVNLSLLSPYRLILIGIFLCLGSIGWSVSYKAGSAKITGNYVTISTSDAIINGWLVVKPKPYTFSVNATTGPGWETTEDPPSSVSLDFTGCQGAQQVVFVNFETLKKNADGSPDKTDFVNVRVFVAYIETETIATVPQDRTRKKIGVGEEVKCKIHPGSLGEVHWSASGGTVDKPVSLEPTFTAGDQAGTAVVTATISGGGKINTVFTVAKPTHGTAIKTSEDSYPPGVQGVGMWLDVTIHPADVSFYNVDVAEESLPASDVTGYFTGVPPAAIYHYAKPWVTLTQQNKVIDHAWLQYCPAPWSPGSFKWDIPVRWKIKDQGGNGESFSQWVYDAFLIGYDGTGKVEKFGYSVIRTP